MRRKTLIIIKSFLFPGDIEKEVEQMIIQRCPDLISTFIKVPHHGSNTSSTKTFLECVAPLYALFPVGYNNYLGLPHVEILERYKRMGIHIFRADCDGNVTIITDGEKIRIKKFRKGCPEKGRKYN